MIYLTLEIARPNQWCACCGEDIDEGSLVLRITNINQYNYSSSESILLKIEHLREFLTKQEVGSTISFHYRKKQEENIRRTGEGTA